MTKPPVSFHDLELLSAYLDGQLNPCQWESLEARLRTQPSLAKELETLQKTRQMLRSLPPLRAPRNFTLAPQKYRKQARARLPALFGAVSALSSAMLIMLVIGSLLLGRTAIQTSLTEELQAYPVAMEASVPEEDLALTMTQKNVAETEPVAPVSDDTSRIADPTPELALVPPAAEASTLALTPAPTLEGLLASGIQEAATPTAYPTQTATQPTPTLLPYEVALPGVTVGVSGGETTPESVLAKIPEATVPTPGSPMATTLFIGEIFLASVALISGLVALILLIRRRR